jgi:hypothetical protein
MPRFAEVRPTEFWLQKAGIRLVESDESCASVGPSHRPTKRLIPTAWNLGALPGCWSQTAIGKTFGSVEGPFDHRLK